MFAMEQHLIWIYSSLLAALTINLVSARYCEGGNHKCMPPKECCAQGCCYLYSPPSAPRQPQPADHVLNLFFINHWYFWLFLFAILLAFILFCSLWKKRHALFCSGWGSSSNHRSPSEGDSAGSCYAPPHYSRCSSFHHAPPPYTEVTSKPDMYPLVFSYTNDGSKNGSQNGANYLMVQYFRNYIVRPIGSLSATSTVDSLSSSFICTANEANTMIPPPYSSANSPDDLSLSLQNYAIPHSASQNVYMNDATSVMIENQQHNGNASSNNRPMSVPNTNQNSSLITSNLQFRGSESVNFVFNPHNGNDSVLMNHQNPMASNSTMTTGSSRSRNQNVISDDEDDFQMATSEGHEQSTSNPTGTVAGTKSHHSTTFNFMDDATASSIYHSNDTILSLQAAMPAIMDKISYSRQTNDNTKLNLIQKQLEKCCEMIQQQQHEIQQTRNHFNATTSFDSASPISGGDNVKKMSDSSMMGLSYMNSNTGSSVSSLANLNSPRSPPQATSPTQEVKELLEQIRQLKDTTFSDDELDVPSQQMSECSKISRECQPGSSTDSNGPQPLRSSLKRPTTLNSKRRFFNVKNRSIYLPISCTSPSSGFVSSFNGKLKSPIAGTASVFMKPRSVRSRTGWISKSAPTTPGTAEIRNFMSDASPLLNEQDEDAEADQNC